MSIYRNYRELPLSEYPAPDCELCGKKMRLRRRAPFYTY